MGDYRKIDIDLYTYGGKQDIDMWLRRYVRAVNNMLADDANDATKQSAYLKYIGTKLDDFPLQIYESSTNQANWGDLRKELVAKLSDPSKAQNFQDKLDFIKWDGEIPLHAYETQILTTTSTLDPELKENDSLFKRETYKRFLAGLPPDYQNYVDIGMPMRSYDLKLARERAEKYEDILKKNLGRNPLASWALPAAAAQPLAGFAAFKENTALQSITDQVSLLSLAQKENLEMQKETNKNITSLIEQLANKSNNQQDNYRPRYRTPSRERQQYNNSRQYDNQRPYGPRNNHNQNNIPPGLPQNWTNRDLEEFYNNAPLGYSGQQNDYQNNQRQNGYQNNNQQNDYQNSNRQNGYQNNNRQNDYQNNGRQSNYQQNGNRSRDGNRQYGNRPNYSSPYRSPNRPPLNQQDRNGPQERNPYRYDKSNERQRQARVERNHESNESGGSNEQGPEVQTPPKGVDFQLPADNASRGRRQGSPHPGHPHKEDF